MSEHDEHERKAAEALPCLENCDEVLHAHNCPFPYRPAVAAALRATREQTRLETLMEVQGLLNNTTRDCAGSNHHKGDL